MYRNKERAATDSFWDYYFQVPSIFWDYDGVGDHLPHTANLRKFRRRGARGPESSTTDVQTRVTSEMKQTKQYTVFLPILPRSSSSFCYILHLRPVWGTGSVCIRHQQRNFQLSHSFCVWLFFSPGFQRSAGAQAHWCTRPSFSSLVVKSLKPGKPKVATRSSGRISSASISWRW